MARKGRIAANLLAQRAAPSAPLARLFGSGSTKSALEWPKCWRIRSAADRGRTAPAAGEYALLRIIIKLVRVFFVCLVLLAIGGGAVVGVTIWYFGRDLPDYQQLAHYEPPITTRVHAGDGRLLAEYSTERRVFMPIRGLPQKAIQPFLAAGAQNFYTHARGRADRSRALAQQAPAGRPLDHHAAGCQGHAAVQRADNVAQDQGGPAGDPDRGGAFQRPHPRAVPERDLSRLGCLRGRGGGADLLQQIARRIDPRRGGVSRRAAEGAQQLQSRPLSAAGEGSPRLGARSDRRGRRRARKGNPGGPGRTDRHAQARRGRNRQWPLFRGRGAARAARPLWRERTL